MKIRKLLKEKTRYERELGQKYSPKYDFISKITEHPCDYAFTMVKIPKVGLNPKTDYNTPAGVYFYPLTQDYYYQLIEDALPFASQSPYCGLAKINWSDKTKWLIFDDAGGSNQDEATYEKIYADLEPLYQKYFPNEPEVHRNLILKSAQLGKHYRNYGVDGKIFDLTYFAANQLAVKAGTKVTIMWTSILRDFGFIGLYDYGAGVIHPSEQTQLVCLDPSAYETIQVYETKDLRRGTDSEKNRIEFQKQQREMQKEQIKNWNQILSQPVEKRVYSPPNGIFYTREFTDLGLPITKLEGIRINGSAVIDFYTYKGAKKVPDNITIDGSASILDADTIGKNVTCTKRIIIKAGLKQIPQGINLKTHTLHIDNLSELTSIPNDIQFTNLYIAGGEFMYLPDNLNVPQDLDIDTLTMKKLPKGLSVGADLSTNQMFASMSLEELSQNFPDDLQVGGMIIGDFPWGPVTGIDLRVFNEIFKFHLKQARKNNSLKEVYNRWKKFI